MTNKSSRVQSNLLQQNCFVRDVSRAVDLKSDDTPVSYVSIDEEVTPSGTKVEFNSYPYPITPQYVNSFVDSSDYRRDPANAVANGVKKSNFGDVRSLQSLSQMDTDSQRALYEELSSKFNKKTDVPVVGSDGGDNNV